MSPKVAVGGMYRVRRYDRFEVKITSNEAAAFYGVMRVLYDDGTDDLFSIPETTLGTDRAVESFLSDHQATQNGWVVGAHLGILRVAVMRGQIYCRMYLNAAGRTQQMIGAGYLYDDHTVNLGDFSESGPGGGHGQIRTVTGTDPAANTEIVETVPTNAIWRLRQFRARCVQGATQTPRPILICDNGTAANRIWVGRSAQQSASTTRDHIFVQGNLTIVLDGLDITDTESIFAQDSIPDDLILIEGERLRTITVGIGANTDYAAPVFRVEEWVTAGAS